MDTCEGEGFGQSLDTWRNCYKRFEQIELYEIRRDPTILSSKQPFYFVRLVLFLF